MRTDRSSTSGPSKHEGNAYVYHTKGRLVGDESSWYRLDGRGRKVLGSSGYIERQTRQGFLIYSIAPMLAHIDPTSVLIVGAMLLACGSASLLIVRVTNPKLGGLGWLGATFLSGGFGALLLAVGRGFGFPVSLPADLLVLLSVVLLRIGILEIRQIPKPFPATGLALMAIQTCTYLYQINVHRVTHVRIIVLGLLVAFQLSQTIALLVRRPRRGGRTPAWFTAFVLLGLMGMNVVRSSLIIFQHSSRSAEFFSELQVLTIIVYIIAAMGVAFGFFWMTTAELTLELEQRANTDPLTRIYNRRIFREWCEREMARYQQTGATFSMLMIDLDHFKSINDRFGHQCGDEMLCAAVERMQDSVRGIDILGRWGGEEFVVLLPGASRDAALLVAERIRANIGNLRLPTGKAVGQAEEFVQITASLGGTTHLGPADSLDAMLRRIDIALYRAKAAGRDTVVVLHETAGQLAEGVLTGTPSPASEKRTATLTA